MSDSNSNIDILKTIAPYIAALEPDDGKADILVKEFQKDIDRLETSYSEVAQDKSRQDETKRLQEALAKGLPAIANGIRDAVKAFQNNDPFAGSAAIIDIAASLSTTIGAMAGTAGGPPGALIGGILSIFSMILKLFSKKAPAKSLETQLLEVIRKYDAEKSLQGLKAAQIGLRAFVDDVDGGSQDRTELEIRELIKTHVGDILHNLTLGGEWLKEPKNQELEEWGLVLAAHCYTYIIYVHCVGMSLKAVATNRDMTNLMSTVYAEHSVQLRFLEEIVPAARRQGLLWVRASDEWWPRRFKVRRAAIPKAKWNDLVESGDHRSFNLLTVTTRTVNAETSDQTNPNLAFFGYVPSAYEKSPPDDSYTLEQAETELDHPFGKILKVASSGQLMGSFGQFPLDQNAQKIGLSPASPGVLISPEIGRTHTNLPDCHDFWATPGFLKGEVNLYATYGSTFLLWRQGSQDHPPGEDPLLYVNGKSSLPAGYKMGIIRAVEPRPFPDEDAKLFFVNTDNTINVVYGACEVAAGKSDIAVDFPEKGVDHMEIRAALAQQLNPKSFVDIKDLGSFLAPWPNFLGIGVDSRYLWVFRAGAIACVTHTSVNQCLREKTPAPPWIEYKIPPTATSVEFDPDSFFTYYGRFYPRGLREICSCEDGTITARIRESIEDRYVYHLVPHIDRHARPPTLVIESTMTDTNGKWVSDSSISAYNLVKQPIFCWPMIEGLMTALQMTVTPVSIDFEDSSTHTVTVKNNSGNPLSIRGVLGGDHLGDFVLSPMLEETLAAGKSRDFEVGFKSMLPSLRMATLWIESGTKNISVILRGNT